MQDNSKESESRLCPISTQLSSTAHFTLLQKNCTAKNIMAESSMKFLEMNRTGKS